MSTAARIDELRKKFEENPRRYFAPLANELRKAGNLSEAIALCREFLPKQPEHMSGYIVFGQALFESGDLPESRTVFEQALALDPENLKALRHLGDIARGVGDTAGARRWYERVLEADPRNDDIAAQLATLATPAYAVRAVSEPEPAAPRPSAFFDPSTPSFAMAPIGLGAIPTPDAALRAVDFDEINERLREPDGRLAELPTTPMPLAEEPVGLEPELLDLEAIEAGGRALGDDVALPHVDAADQPETVSDGLSMESANESVGTAGDDPFGFDDAESDDDPFEEGLLAPDWPDTSALVARMGTPRSITPPFVAAMMTPDAVAAFGIEPGDPLPTPALDEGALMAETEAPFDPAEGLSEELPLVLTAASDAASEYAATREALWETDADSESDDELLAGAPGADEVADDEADDELDDAEPEWIVASIPSASPSRDDELPWLDAASDGEPDRVAEADAEVTALFVDDSTDVTDVDVEGSPTEASFADVLPEEYNPAFVTETMGELLVSQGFTARAVSVYEELVRRRPYDPMLTSRLAELHELLVSDAASETEAVQTAQVEIPAFVTTKRLTPPVSDTPMSDTPVPDTPVSSPAFDASVDADGPADRVTARERFAQLASRRVPRRTPPRATVAVEAPLDSLASLFGGDAPLHDDLAARALADAFAPIDDVTHFGGDLPFEDAMLGGASRAPTPLRGATPIATAAVSDVAAGSFSFDRFFPDPASASRPQQTPPHSPTNTPASEPVSDIAPPAASDDLAQFSVWLKGLGNT